MINLLKETADIKKQQEVDLQTFNEEMKLVDEKIRKITFEEVIFDDEIKINSTQKEILNKK